MMEYAPLFAGAALVLLALGALVAYTLAWQRERAGEIAELADRLGVGETTGDLSAADGGVRGRHGDPWEDTANVDAFALRLRLDMEDVESELSAGLAAVVARAHDALHVSQNSVRLAP